MNPVTTLDLKPVAGAYEVPVDKIEPNINNPRQRFDEAELALLADDIRDKGIIQPIVVRPHRTRRGWFSLVSGERRWRAARDIYLTIPAIVRRMTDVEAAEFALAENIQRESLTSLEEANGVKRLIEMWEADGQVLTNASIAKRLSVTPSYVTKTLQFLGLPAEFLKVAEERKQVRSSLLLINEQLKDDQSILLEMVRAGGSFRDVETEVNQMRSQRAATKAAHSFPDRETAERATAFARGESSSVGRGGARITSPKKPSKAQLQAQAREDATRHMTGLAAAILQLSDEDFKKYALPFARRILSGDLRKNRPD